MKTDVGSFQTITKYEMTFGIKKGDQIPKNGLLPLEAVLTRHPSAPPLRRHYRELGEEGATGGIERHPVRRWKWGRGEWRRMWWPSKVETFQDALTHFLHFANQLSLRRTQ